MKTIQWFPGHMTKALRMMEDNLKLCDGAVVVLDARCPVACLSRRHEALFANKPVLYVLNKSDLVPPQTVKAFVASFEKAGRRVAAVSANGQKDVPLLRAKIDDLFAEKRERNRKKGVNLPMRVMVAGIPNTGKSTLINALAGEKKAVTGDKAGVTRGKQWIRVGNLDLLDTPGTMPPYFDSQRFARHLAYVGSINDDILDFDDLSLCFLEEIAGSPYLPLLTEKYGVTGQEETPLLMLEQVASSRGFLLRGGEIDYDRAARAVINDFRKGRMGKIALETATAEEFAAARDKKTASEKGNN